MAGDRRHTDLNSAALRRARVHPDLAGLTGAGSVICVIDYGFDVLHPALRTRAGETRFAALIDQNGGRLMRSEINRLIRTCERDGSRRALDSIYDAHANYFGRHGVQIGAHGSWVGSIAAGSRTKDFCGVAPAATLIGVQLDLPDSAWLEEDDYGQPTWIEAAIDGSERLQTWDGWRSYEESTAIIAAINDGYELARSLRPEGIVINLSIGAWGGGHDAQSPVNRTIEAITENGQCAGEPTTFVVAGTGNAGADTGHAGGALDGSGPVELEWSIDTRSRQQSKLEIWSDCGGDLCLEVRSGKQAGEVAVTLDGVARGTMAITARDGQVIGVAENRGVVRDGLLSMRILLHPGLVLPAPTGLDHWPFEICVRAATANDRGVVHAWIERDCSGAPLAQVRPKQQAGHDPYGRASAEYHNRCSLTSIACAASVIAVAGLDNRAAGDEVIAMSGCGPRPWRTSSPARCEMPSPLLGAPANGLFGARSKSAGYMRGSGTSGAAAVVSGATALAFEAAEMAGRKLSHTMLVDALLGRTRTLRDVRNWQPDLGFGAMRFDASAILGSAASRGSRRAGPALPAVVSRKENISDERTLSPPV